MTASDASREQYEALWSDLWANLHAGGPMARTRYRLALRWLRLHAHSRERILDVGAGNGAFMATALSRAPGLSIFGAEFSQTAMDLAHPAIRNRIAPCDLQGREPLPWGGDFEAVTCMEVLEHLEDDVCALGHISKAILPGGRLFISVPAWQRKWGPQDEAAGHVRRYERDMLSERVVQAGLRIERMKCWGGPLSWMYLRSADRIGPKKLMKMRPTGGVGIAAAAIYQILKLDDFTSFGRGDQWLLLARKAAA